MIEGKKIRLRPFTIEDAIYITELKNDFAGYKAFGGSPFPANIASEKEWIANMYPKGLPSFIYFAIEGWDDKVFYGYCVARKIDYVSRNAEVGIILIKAARGKGLFKEVSYLFYNYLFSEINLHKVYSFVIEGNLALKADKKIGFIEEGLVKEHLWQDGKYKNLHFVSLYSDNFYQIWKDGLNSAVT